MCPTCTITTNALNSAASAFMLAIRNPILTKWVIVITTIGGPINVSMFCLVLVMVFWLHGKMRTIVQFLGSLAACGVVTLIFKALVALPRPTGALVQETGYSFVSAHASIATIFFLLIAYTYKSHIKNTFLRFCFVALNVLIILVIGLSRIYLGVHYASDVLGGFLVGVMIFAFSVMIFEVYNKKHPVSW